MSVYDEDPDGVAVSMAHMIIATAATIGAALTLILAVM